MPDVQFGWTAPTIGLRETNYVPFVIMQQEKVLPAVEKHFDSVWLYEHLYGFAERTDPYLENWTTLTWLAARFPKLLVGSLVLSNGLRNPALLAKMAATLQTLSGGRLVLGIGTGWREEEYRAYGYPFPPVRERAEQLEEAVQIMRLMWTERAPTFKGKHYTIENAYSPPLPNPPPPIMIGAGGEKITIPLVARVADWWNCSDTGFEGFRRKRELLIKHTETANRDPAEIKLTYSFGSFKLPESADDSAHLVDELRPYVDLDVSHFMFDCGIVTSTEPIERFAEEVMRPLREG